MSRKQFVLITCLTLMLISGCAGTLPVNSYEPQNIVRCEGKTAVSGFTYAPFDKGVVSRANQIHNTALGSIYISVDVAEFVKRATALELEKTGIALSDDAPYAVEGRIEEFDIDDLGYSVDWSYAISYVIRDKTTNEIAFEKIFRPAPLHSGKFGRPSDFSSTLSEIVLAGYNLFIHDKGATDLLKNAAPSTGIKADSE